MQAPYAHSFTLHYKTKKKKECTHVMRSSMPMIHIRLSTIFYTHVEHRPTNANNIKYYLGKAMNAMKSNYLYTND